MHLHVSFLASALFLFCLNGSVQELKAQRRYADTFYLTMADKTPAHPYYGVGYHKGLVLDGVEGGTMILVRDSFYLVDWSEVTDELLPNFYTVPIGGGRNVYHEIVFEWVPSKRLVELKAKTIDKGPDTLYYASTRQPWVGGMILVVDSLPTSAVDVDRANVNSNIAATAHPNPVDDLTRIVFPLEYASHVRLDVIDPLGHVVMSAEEKMEGGDQSIVFNAEPLADGIYFIRIIALDGSSTRC